MFNFRKVHQILHLFRVVKLWVRAKVRFRVRVRVRVRLGLGLGLG